MTRAMTELANSWKCQEAFSKNPLSSGTLHSLSAVKALQDHPWQAYVYFTGSILKAGYKDTGTRAIPQLKGSGFRNPEIQGRPEETANGGEKSSPTI